MSAFISLVGVELAMPGNVTDVFLSSHFDRIEESYRQEFIRYAWDPELGWGKRSPDRPRVSTNSAGEEWTATYDEDQSRHTGLVGLPLLAAAYGDSFTHSSEVNDDQTWAYTLSISLGAEVKNYGVPGYGTGQALLRMERHLRQGRVPPVLILTIYENNVERLLSHFRPFRSPKTRAPLSFKPAFRRSASGEVRLISNVYDHASLSLDDLRQRADALRSADYWASRKAELSFPFVFQLLRLVRFHVEEFTRRGGEGQYRADLEPGQVMRHIVDRFVVGARERGSTPLLLFIPYKERLKPGSWPTYLAFVAETRTRHPELEVVDVFEAEFERERFNIRPFDGHASPYGNQIIAQLLAERIRALPLSGAVEPQKSRQPEEPRPCIPVQMVESRNP
jgi:lysophospholipase L1-like esterase